MVTNNDAKQEIRNVETTLLSMLASHKYSSNKEKLDKLVYAALNAMLPKLIVEEGGVDEKNNMMGFRIRAVPSWELN